MERVIEKSRTTICLPGPAGQALDAMAVISLALATLGAALVAGGASWRVAAYVSIAGVLFDMLFSYEFFIRVFNKERPFPWILGCSSILPLLLVSGPFLSAWVLLDLEASAVRGLWLGKAPISGLAVISALRLLRLARPFSVSNKRASATEQRQRKGRRIAGVAGISVLLLGAACADVLIIPGIAWASQNRRNTVIEAMSHAESDKELVAIATSAGVLALRLDGRVLIQAPKGHAPGHYATLTRGGIELWFSVSDENRSRSAMAAIALLAGLSAATAYAIILFAPLHSGSLGINRRSRYKRDSVQAKTELRTKPVDRPAGTAELVGILGKPLP